MLETTACLTHWILLCRHEVLYCVTSYSQHALTLCIALKGFASAMCMHGNKGCERLTPSVSDRRCPGLFAIARFSVTVSSLLRVLCPTLCVILIGNTSTVDVVVLVQVVHMKFAAALLLTLALVGAASAIAPEVEGSAGWRQGRATFYGGSQQYLRNFPDRYRN